MTTLQNPPLIEAIFELQWGEVALGQFSYTQEEQSLFAGKISTSAASKGYAVTEIISQNMSFALPMQVTHRFRRQSNSHPCFQVGLGVFTVNQGKEGYHWSTFKESIKTGLDIYNHAEPNKLNEIKGSLSLSLRCQDAFFPEPNISTVKYLEEHFHVQAGLPKSFLDNANIDSSKINIHMGINIETLIPKGTIQVQIINAIINNQSGLLMETIVQSKAKESLNEAIDVDEIMNWLEQAHNLQKHTFETLIKPSAYE